MAKESRAVQAHAKAVAWAQSVTADPSTCFLDTETTGKEHDSGICDIGIVAIDGTVLMDRLVKPSLPIPDEASAIHGITNAMVADAWTFDQLWPEVLAIISDRRIVIYNADYDTAILTNAFTRAGQDYTVKGECAMRSFADFEGFPGKWPGSFKWFRLEDAAAKFGLKPGGHRALADAIACKDVVCAMAAAGAVPAVTHPPPEPQRTLFDLSDPNRFAR